ncbi:hypothetical protein B4U80_10913 [Leptotrombidium deliense]|uniref:Uncharacterized protein n=1 Tax=Leptotrombidium deliense TaxID=299467 RepID=A0A443SWU4_9ACAR|nr:hypothetical protein B4U80_10913 [Leptotrombidium deliense]
MEGTKDDICSELIAKKKGRCLHGRHSTPSLIFKSDTSFEAVQAVKTTNERAFSSKDAAAALRPANDAALEDALKSEEDFIEYVMNLQTESNKSRRESRESMDSKLNNNAGFEQLDNLCKLMQQLTDLKRANSKLQRKVQCLEDSSHRNVNGNTFRGNTAETRNNVSTETRKACSETVVKERRFAIHKSKSHTAVSRDMNSLRERSKSVGHEEIARRSISEKCIGNRTSKKFAKWSKVKEALGFEKASSHESDSAVCKQNRYSPFSKDIKMNNSSKFYVKDYSNDSDNESVPYNENDSSFAYCKSKVDEKRIIFYSLVSSAKTLI